MQTRTDRHSIFTMQKSVMDYMVAAIHKYPLQWFFHWDHSLVQYFLLRYFVQCSVFTSQNVCFGKTHIFTCTYSFTCPVLTPGRMGIGSTMVYQLHWFMSSGDLSFLACLKSKRIKEQIHHQPGTTTQEVLVGDNIDYEFYPARPQRCR